MKKGANEKIDGSSIGRSIAEDYVLVLDAQCSPRPVENFISVPTNPTKPKRCEQQRPYLWMQNVKNPSLKQIKNLRLFPLSSAQNEFENRDIYLLSILFCKF